MSFFNQEQYLESIHSNDEMRIRETAPLFTRSASPEKKLTMRLEDIPEATPGPNAFAQEAARKDRHRLEGNAFYQQEVQKRKITPPIGVHPALRIRSSSEPPTPPRDSTCTTMSRFINAAGTERQHSPPLKLVPSDADMAEPTTRGYIEEHREHRMHEQSGSEEDRTPVFIPTPKVPSSEFVNPSSIPRKIVSKDVSFAELPTRTPKKGFLERLKISTNTRSTQLPGASNTNDALEAEDDQGMPVKARAVLGASPSKGRTSLGSSTSRISLPRSPSKRKGFFSRNKNTGLADSTVSNLSLVTTIESDDTPQTASTVTKTPQTAISDPTHYSFQSKRTVSQTLSDNATVQPRQVNKCAIARSQSLKYFDHGPPPTPPAKNTPPDVKAKRDAALAKQSSRLPFHDGDTTSPKVPEGVVSTSERLSPTRFGSYGHRETATLVTQPSVYSLHASVVPNLTEATTFEEMKARFDGLALEGFNPPAETVRSPHASVIYTPSIYSTDWATRPGSTFVSPSPRERQMPRESATPSSHTKGSSSGGEIPICYPELAKDPSMNDMMPLRGNEATSQSQARRGRARLAPGIPWHGRTHSPDHSVSPRHSVDSTIFAQHVDDDLHDTFHDSPTSFSHASATPSPLHALPSAVYTPPPRKDSKSDTGGIATGDYRGQAKITTRSGLGIQLHLRSDSASPSRRNEIFENEPALRAQPSQTRRSPSLHNNSQDPNHAINVDPQKQSPEKSPATDKLDRMIEMLSTLNARNDEITTMRDEMRTTNARLGERLAAVENISRFSPPPSYLSDDSSGTEGPGRRSRRTRMPTQMAHDFYRDAEAGHDIVEEDLIEVDPDDSSTITELKETNRRLLELVGGFADKIDALEKKVKGGV